MAFTRCDYLPSKSGTQSSEPPCAERATSRFLTPGEASVTPTTIESVRHAIEAMYTSKGPSRNFTAEEKTRYKALLADEQRILRT